jgi:2-haloacid dehalogenase
MKIRGIIFDAYGTLFDVHAVVRAAGAGIEGVEPLSRLWRQKQVEHTWRRALMDRYQDFWHVTRESLLAAAAELGTTLSSEQIDRLMQAYLATPAFPEAEAALEQLRGIPLAILSNGNMAMLEAATQASGLARFFQHVISVDPLRTYKPKSEVYALGPRTLGIPAEELLFVSSNGWDASGAKAFGYSVCWCNRSGAAMDVLGFKPDFVVATLTELPTIAAL